MASAPDPDILSVVKAPHPLGSQPAVLKVLSHLHAASLQQEEALALRGSHFPVSQVDDTRFEHQLVALDEDKAQAMYLILRAMGATRVVEAGTSYGVSLIWLLAAVLESEKASSVNKQHPALVVGTEKEPAKVQRALAHVKEAFGSLPSALNLLEGDLLVTLLDANIPDGSIDAVLLDIWAPLALPTLKILVPKLRIGAVVLIDNTETSKERYADLLGYIRYPQNGFVSTTLPFSGGFELSVYTGSSGR